jgi:CheY-like chemotaxis protein
MPGKNGFEVCAYVKAHSALSNTPVILLVGAYDPFNEEAAAKVGAAAHITKPFEPRALIELVKSVLSGAATPARPAPPVRTMDTPAPPPVTPTAETAVDTHVDTHFEANDLLGLAELFQPEIITVPVHAAASLSVEEIDRIADRVIRKISAQIVESIAWDVVPDIAVKILRDELHKNNS